MSRAAAERSKGGRVLVVDDERDMAESCRFFLDRAGYEVETCGSAERALQRMEEASFDVVVTDLRMPRMSGLALLEAIKARDAAVEVLVITGFPEIETAVEAIRKGALDYVTKPFSEQDLLERIDKAFAQSRERAAGGRTRDEARAANHRLVYCSDVFAELVRTLERVAHSDATVLMQGESGTGKELLAHRLHDVSSRTGRPFVPVDCAAVPADLVESELFGHVKGAFSGAAVGRPGLFQVADGGTLFLDEVGDLPLAFQPKLLRAIQERQVRRVGAKTYEDVDVRIVCATNRNLGEMVEQGTFRQDLYYRLDVIGIDVPPLRDHPDDVEPLALRFLESIRERGSCSYHGFEPAALVALRSHAWPGNVRQLRNVIERICAVGSGSLIGVEDLPAELRAEPAVVGEQDLHGSFQQMKARKVAAIESAYLETLLRRNHGNVTHSAADAGMSRSAFQKLMQRYGIRSASFRE